MASFSKQEYEEYYKKALEKMLSREITFKDGFPLDRITKAEKRLKIKLPKSLRQYYEMAGKLEINKQHNVLYSPGDLETSDNYLVIMEENQSVAFWGIKVKDITKDDPVVYQAVNIEPIKWYSEKLPFSKFIIKMWQWETDGGC